MSNTINPSTMGTRTRPPGESLVLVVDDMPRNIQVVGNLLREAGYQVAAATSGATALRAMQARPADLVVLDVMMPEMDGYEVCRRLRSDPATCEVPVLFLTAAADTDMLVKGFAEGAVDYVTKPFKSAELLARVRNHLDLKHSRELLKQNAERLQQLDDEKNEFLGILAHDLKNPLSGIVGFADLLLDEPSMPVAERAEHIDMIRTSADRMMMMVRNLLDANAIERGQLMMDLAVFDLVEVIKYVMESFRARASAKGQTMHLEHPDGPIYAQMDRNLGIQVLDNLISNAIKYSPHGKNIWLRVRREPGFSHFEVQDEGPGLSESDQRKLFTNFARLAPVVTAPGEDSTGLGLAIVKRVVQAMRGRIGAISELGKGSIFWVKFPAAHINIPSSGPSHG